MYIIVSGSTLESKFLFVRSSQKIRRQISSPNVYKVKYLYGLESCDVVGKPSDERECSEKLHFQSYLEMLWYETGYFGLLGNNHICFCYPIISYQRIRGYMVEILDMGRSHWNKGVIGTFLISISTTVLVVRDKILW